MNLSDTFYLSRAGRYSHPKSTNDILPLVYGDLSDETVGVWTLPCIDTVNFVYCFAAHAVLSAAAGNIIGIYKDGTLVDPVNYTFNESNDYEGNGAIATINLTSDQSNSVITARGMGKEQSGALMTNVIDIVNDVLTVENDFTSDLYEATSKARAAQVFENQGYKAAGVICKDTALWDILKEMMGSFLGSAYLNGEGKLVLSIDTGGISEY